MRKGKRGRAAAGNVPVFGLLKRGGKVFTAIIPNARSRTLLPIIREQVSPDSIVYADSFTAYDGLDVSEFHHRRVNPSKVFVTKRRHHINGIENFWNQAKRHVRRFNGLTPDNLLVLDGVRVALQWRQPPAAVEAAQILVQVTQALVLS